MLNSNEERLQKALARAGIASRRACEDLIAAGRVKVNGKIVTLLGTKIDPIRDRVTVDDSPVAVRASAAPQKIYLMLNKPQGYLSTVVDPQGRPTVLDLVDEPGVRRLYPVGRLDADSEGLLLLTNDGAFANALSHPRYGVEKEYIALLDGIIAMKDIEALRNGVTIRVEDPETGEHGPHTTRVAKVDLVRHEGSNSLVRFILKEGKKRQIRLMAEAVEHPVIELRRVRYGLVKLGDLGSGKYRPLTKAEVHALVESARQRGENETERPTQPAPRGRTEREGSRPSEPFSPRPPRSEYNSAARPPRSDSGPARSPRSEYNQAARPVRNDSGPFRPSRSDSDQARPNRSDYSPARPDRNESGPARPPRGEYNSPARPSRSDYAPSRSPRPAHSDGDTYRPARNVNGPTRPSRSAPSYNSPARPPQEGREPYRPAARNEDWADRPPRPARGAPTPFRLEEDSGPARGPRRSESGPYNRDDRPSGNFDRGPRRSAPYRRDDEGASERPGGGGSPRGPRNLTPGKAPFRQYEQTNPNYSGPRRPASGPPAGGRSSDRPASGGPPRGPRRESGPGNGNGGSPQRSGPSPRRPETGVEGDAVRRPRTPKPFRPFERPTGGPRRGR